MPVTDCSLPSMQASRGRACRFLPCPYLMSSVPVLAAELLLYTAMLMYSEWPSPGPETPQTDDVQPIKLPAPAFKCLQLVELMPRCKPPICEAAQSHLLSE